MDKIGIGVIGCGSIAELAHFPSIKRSENVELISVCDIDEERAKETNGKWRAKYWYTDYKEMLEERDDLEAVIIASPPKFHCEQGIACAEKGVIGKVMMGRATMHEHVKFYQDNIAKTDFRLKPEIAGASAVADTAVPMP